MIFSSFLFSLFLDLVMQHTIIFSVTPINEIGDISGPAPVFALKGSGCSSCKNSYRVITNGDNKKISAFLDQDMPSGFRLGVNLSPPSGARSMGMQQLSATPVDLVVEISRVNEEGLPMVYEFFAGVKGGAVSNATRVVTYTLTDG
jgi:hypothetical protein